MQYFKKKIFFCATAEILVILSWLALQTSSLPLYHSHHHARTPRKWAHYPPKPPIPTGDYDFPSFRISFAGPEDPPPVLEKLPEEVVTEGVVEEVVLTSAGITEEVTAVEFSKINPNVEETPKTVQPLQKDKVEKHVVDNFIPEFPKTYFTINDDRRKARLPGSEVHLPPSEVHPPPSEVHPPPSEVQPEVPFPQPNPLPASSTPSVEEVTDEVSVTTTTEASFWFLFPSAKGNAPGVNKTPLVMPVTTEGKNTARQRLEDPVKVYGIPKELLPIMPGGGSRFEDVEREKLEKKKMSQTKGGANDSAENGSSHEAERLYSSASLSSLSLVFYCLMSFFHLDRILL